MVDHARRRAGTSRQSGLVAGQPALAHLRHPAAVRRNRRGRCGAPLPGRRRRPQALRLRRPPRRGLRPLPALPSRLGPGLAGRRDAPLAGGAVATADGTHRAGPLGRGARRLRRAARGRRTPGGLAAPGVLLRRQRALAVLSRGDGDGRAGNRAAFLPAQPLRGVLGRHPFAPRERPPDRRRGSRGTVLRGGQRAVGGLGAGPGATPSRR